jgi:protein TonB
VPRLPTVSVLIAALAGPALGQTILVPRSSDAEQTQPAVWLTPEVPDPQPAPAATTPVAAPTLIRFDVTEEGRVENCSVVESSGRTELDAKACDLVRTGSYAPALKRGKAVRSTKTTRVRWEVTE